MLLFVVRNHHRGGGDRAAVFRQYASALAAGSSRWPSANFSLQCVENAAWMSLFNLSQDFGKLGAAANVDANTN